MKELEVDLHCSLVNYKKGSHERFPFILMSNFLTFTITDHALKLLGNGVRGDLIVSLIEKMIK